MDTRLFEKLKARIVKRFWIGDANVRCQLKFLSIYQLSVKLWIISQLSVNWLLTMSQRPQID